MRRLLLVTLLALGATIGLGSSSAFAASCSTQPAIGSANSTHYDGQHFNGNQLLDCGTRDIAQIKYRVHFKTSNGAKATPWEAYQYLNFTSGQHAHGAHIGSLSNNFNEACVYWPYNGLYTWGMEWDIQVTFISGTFPNNLLYTQYDSFQADCGYSTW